MNIKELKKQLFKDINNDFDKNKDIYMFYLYPLMFNVKTTNKSISLLLKKQEITKFKSYNKIDKYKQSNYIKDIKEIIKKIFKSNYITINNNYAINYINKLTKKQSSINNIKLIYRLLPDLKNKKGGDGENKENKENNSLVKALTAKQITDYAMSKYIASTNIYTYMTTELETAKTNQDKDNIKYYEDQLQIFHTLKDKIFKNHKENKCLVDTIFYNIFDKLNFTEFLKIPDNFIFDYDNDNYNYLNKIFADYTHMSSTNKKYIDLLNAAFKHIYYIDNFKIVSDNNTNNIELVFRNQIKDKVLQLSYNKDNKNICYLYILHNFSEFFTTYLKCINEDNQISIKSSTIFEYNNNFNNMMPAIQYLFFILSYLYSLILHKSVYDDDNIIVKYFSDTQPNFLKKLLLINDKIFDINFSFDIYKLILTINVSNLYILRNYNILKSKDLTYDISYLLYIQLKNYIDHCVFMLLKINIINKTLNFDSPLTIEDFNNDTKQPITRENWITGQGYEFCNISLANIIYTFINKDNPLFNYKNNNIKYLHLIRLYTFSTIQQIEKYLNIIYSISNYELDMTSYNGKIKDLYKNIELSIIYNNNGEKYINSKLEQYKILT